MPELNANIAALMQIINEELRLSNVFVNRLLATAEANGWSDKQTLAQLVVILGRENNRLQDDLLKAEHAKAYPEPVSIQPPKNDIGATHWALTPDQGLLMYRVGDSVKLWLDNHQTWIDAGDAPYTLNAFDDHEKN